MTDPDTHDRTDSPRAETDGSGAVGAARVQETDYLDREVNLLRPSTEFMRDHLRIIWTGFVAWLLIVFGPVTLTVIAPGPMTTTMPMLGFPLHYFMAAIAAPGGALLLAVWYARKRDRLDERYGIGTPAEEPPAGQEPAAADGGEVQ